MILPGSDTFSIVNPDIRWQQRFENYGKALQMLREALVDIKGLSGPQRVGVVQRFEFTFELAWRTMKDYLVSHGVVLEQNTPGNVIKQAFAAKIISDDQLWIEMLDCRTLMEHTYEEDVFDRAIQEMASRFLPAFDQLYDFLKGKNAP
jgi:nucleotidyltransferase substrate binding protein (TIGR01987 family)